MARNGSKKNRPTVFQRLRRALRAVKRGWANAKRNPYISVAVGIATFVGKNALQEIIKAVIKKFL